MIDLKNIVRKNILELTPYSSAREEFSGLDSILLDANENPFGNLNRYPDPYQKKLVEKLAAIKGVSTSSIFIGNGSDEIIDLAFRIFCDPGKEKALTFVPTYGMYEVSAAINNIELIKIQLDSNFQLDSKSILNYMNDVSLKLIFICSPNNPTGDLIAEKAIKFVLENFKGIVVIDEAYIDFGERSSWNKQLENYPNLIVLQTLSKAWALAGARIGIAYSNSKIIQLFNKVSPPYNVSSLNQQAALNALNNTAGFKKKITLLKNEKKKLEKNLNSLSLVKKIYPSSTNFLLVEVTDANEIYDALTQQQIIVRNRNNEVKNCLRITVGSPNENEFLIKALKNIAQ